jgi:hypothetical protein
MTCDDCQAILIDMTRGRAVDPASRDEARRHAALCSPCGEQQQEQQWLTTQFRAIAVADAGRQAPERVEIAALAAWRAEYGAAAQAQSHTQAQSQTQLQAKTQGKTQAKIVTLALATAVASTRTADSSTRRWLLPGVAVAGLAAAALALIVVWPSSSHVTPGVAISHAPEAIAKNATPPGTSAAPARNSQSEGASVPVTRSEVPPAAVAASLPEMAVRPAARVETVLARATTGNTEFLPLPYVEPLRSTEARHVVRVSMTSGDEMILGVLPVDRRNGQPFEADVLVGEDGIARGIRIVR